MSALSSCPPRPRGRRTKPSYPRVLLAAGIALNVVGCMSASPDPYRPGNPSSQVIVVQQPPAGSTTGFAQPPPGDDANPVDPLPPPPPIDPPDDDPPLGGEAPDPFTP